MRKRYSMPGLGSGGHPSGRWGIVLALAAGLGASGPAQAVQFDLGPELDLSWTSTLGYSLGYRVETQDDEILGMINADDGDRAFDRGVMKNKISGLTEMSLDYGNYGAFIRADAFFDRVYDRDSDNHSASTDNTPSNPPDEFVDKTEDVNRSDVRLLDAFVYGNFAIGGTNLNVRVGRQVVSWGESLFLAGISSVQNPVDVTESHEPAVEVKKLLLPVGQVLGRWQLTGNLSVAGYYQWQWEETRIDGTGSYFATTDILQGGEVILARDPTTGTIVPALSRTPDDDARDSGQYGLNVHYTVPQWAYTDFGVYYLRYHDKAPSVVFGGFGVIPGMPNTPTTYHAKYFEDIELYGLSFATAFGRVQLGGEVSLKEGAPVLDANGSPVRADALQAQLNTITNIPLDLLGANTTTLSAEIGINEITDREDSELTNDKRAAGYQASLSLAYTNVLPSLDVTVPLSVSQGFHQDSSVPGSFDSGNVQLGIGANMTYGDNWTIDLNYVEFRGDPSDNLLTDRDFVSVDIGYSI